MNRYTLAAAAVSMVAVAACSNKSRPVDASLQADLAAATGGNVNGDIQLAPKSSAAQVIDREDAPQAAPERASAKPVNHTPKPKPQPKPQASVAEAPPAPAPAPQPQAAPAPTEAPAPTPAPRPQPMPAEQP